LFGDHDEQRAALAVAMSAATIMCRSRDPI
jgi:hypothetical protein